MQLVKVNIIDLKKFEDSPILEERYMRSPVVVINENNEILFGTNPQFSPFIDDQGLLTCLQISSSEIPSAKACFDLHYVGMQGIINYDKFNGMAKEQTGAPYDLFLFDAPQFERAVAAKKYIKAHTSDEGLF